MPEQIVLERSDAPARLRASASGAAPYRVLVVGERESLAGDSGTPHDGALPGPLARALGRSLGHGVDVEGLVVPSARVEHLDAALRGRTVAHLDAVVVLLDRAADQADPEGVERLLGGLAERMAESAVLLVGLPASRATGEDAFAAEVRAAAEGIAEVVDLSAEADAPRRPMKRFADWAADLAFALESALMAPQLWGGAAEVVDEADRILAAEQASAATSALEADLADVVRRAARRYRTRSAAISLIDGDRTHYLAYRNLGEPDVVREQSICSTVVQTYGGLIVPDARRDPRFRDVGSVRSGDVVFYAGYRIVSPEGLPVGVLCVFDPEEREVTEDDLVVLRDLALTVERRLWQVWPAAS